MRRLSASDIILKALGVLFLTAAVLKAHELLTTPVANKDLLSWRPFLIFQVEFELAIGIWLLSGILKPLVWLIALACFSLFSMITFYKGIAGYASCGCFGSVHVNPWITLFVIDLPAVIALSLFRPSLSLWSFLSFLRKQESIKSIIKEFLTPLPSLKSFVITVVIGITTLGITTPILAFNEPPKSTSRYEVLEPETWVGQKLPILEHIDIQEQLNSGNWLILLYNHDCPDCQEAIPQYQRMAEDLAGNEDFLRIVLVEVPPYYRERLSEQSPVCRHGRLSDIKQWFVTTPCVLLLADRHILQVWQNDAPDLNKVLESMQL